jgi:hypothetical protein
MRYITDIQFAFDAGADALVCAAAVEGFPGLSLEPGESVQKGVEVNGVQFVRGRLGFDSAEAQTAFSESLAPFRASMRVGENSITTHICNHDTGGLCGDTSPEVF